MKSENKSIEHWWRLRKKINSKNLIKRFIYQKKYSCFCKKYNSFISYGANIEELPVFPHELYGIFISGGARIGKNCVIFHQVTIGSNTLNDSKRKGAPTIGDNVYIGCGAKIIGEVKVGNNVRIGANCVVTEDVPDNATVVLQKPRIIMKTYIQDNTFQKYKVKKDEEK